MSERFSGMQLAILCLLASAALPTLSQEETPVFVLTPEESKITFYIKSSVALEGTFKKWDATMARAGGDGVVSRLHTGLPRP